MATSKRGRGPELRVRTGCRRCRERRVKCPEQRPVCKACEVRGLACSYELVLRWDNVDVRGGEGECVPCVGKRRPFATQEWMFLNAGQRDFASESCLASNPRSSPEVDAVVSIDPFDKVLSTWPENDHDPWTNSNIAMHLLPSLSPLQLSPVETHLWEYFQKAISPSCVLNPKANPYQDVILRIAAYAGRASPLFHGIMSISANQLYNLGDRTFHEPSWTYRHQALRGLRLETARYGAGGQDVMRAGQIVAVILLMCFLEISHDCSDSWVLHASFGRALIKSIKESNICDPDIQALFTFANAYIVSHEIFAHTAWSPSQRQDYDDAIAELSDDESLQTMTGCSKDFLHMLSSINVLAADVKKPPESTSAKSIDERRLELERRLHGWNRDQQPDDLDDEDIAEGVLVAETKRLAGLLYLYSRTSYLGPRDPYMLKLTSRILRLISRVSSRTNAILWPLFMVATLGVRPECDADRAAVLERLDGLQRTRQLGSVKKARMVIDSVWRIRDLQASAANLGWDILEMTACRDKISLA